MVHRVTNTTSPEATDAAKAAFAEIASRFPHLRIIEEADVPIRISLDLPVQPGLKHRVWLGHQNEDELNFGVGPFWCDWFPCTSEEKRRDYVEAVTGFLSGRYRILEHWRADACFKAQLQRPSDGGWETIATWSKARLPSFRKVTYIEVINAG